MFFTGSACPIKDDQLKRDEELLPCARNMMLGEHKRDQLLLRFRKKSVENYIRLMLSFFRWSFYATKLKSCVVFHYTKCCCLLATLTVPFLSIIWSAQLQAFSCHEFQVERLLSILSTALSWASGYCVRFLMMSLSLAFLCLCLLNYWTLSLSCVVFFIKSIAALNCFCLEFYLSLLNFYDLPYFLFIFRYAFLCDFFLKKTLPHNTKNLRWNLEGFFFHKNIFLLFFSLWGLTFVKGKDKMNSFWPLETAPYNIIFHWDFIYTFFSFVEQWMFNVIERLLCSRMSYSRVSALQSPSWLSYSSLMNPHPHTLSPLPLIKSCCEKQNLKITSTTMWMCDNSLNL